MNESHDKDSHIPPQTVSEHDHEDIQENESPPLPSVTVNMPEIEDFSEENERMASLVYQEKQRA